MSQSVYLKLATFLVKADLRLENRKWKRRVRRAAFHAPVNNSHLMHDIGLEADGRFIADTVPDNVKTERRIRHLRRVLSLRIST
ncbi:DUF1127 domain-containing protein [Vibrio pectenicida]|uniref:DUF1127 domain-containing protein n=1 Tax=Vibrio pectenicida TaxID=62763 RepID=A0A427TTW5_9VIBR|nr:DUF1127 domain-containing protein [Vibrio pectenicida]RSD27900.1 DUF1127 domain-containing protein [Vibrio pectenicida]